MIEKKELKIHELKYYYDNRHGFTFQASEKSSSDSIQKAVEMLKRIGVTNSLPECYVEHGDTLIFIYPEKCEFLSGPFSQAVNQICGKLPFLIGGNPFKIEILNQWLKEH